MNETSVLDLHAAWIRRSERDLKAFLEALAVRLEGALPSQVQVERKRDGLFSKTLHVERITIRSDVKRYVLENTGHDIRVSRAKEVHGVVLKTEMLSLREWLADLEGDLQRLSGQMTDASGILHQFLMN